ncbi:hypothetical protein [Candidatus Symbiopectobacterium sp. NZEC135]|uniref:hypothetical protein n=1 Tax=Candidatus Symbiopectobacterium sp. NZEC135 TaxID=2820471 RepID=UPI00222634A6|nr:hypothetical protein [Candidatus Symbiopectobacterium sp. NZEC135]MCW2477879.1 hypothetical protein [Candidatus Symbiopectobacterium sp. NZEC135]
MKKFMPPLPPASTKNTSTGSIKHDFQKASNIAIKFIPSDSFVRKHGKLLQDLNSRLAAGRPLPIKKPLIATPAPTSVSLSTFTPPAPIKPGQMGMPPPPPPMPPASYVPPRIIQTDTVSTAPVVREKKGIKPETTPQYNSVMDELKKRLEASSLKMQTVNH